MTDTTETKTKTTESESKAIDTALDTILNWTPDQEPLENTPISIPVLPEGVQVIDLIENMNYNLAQAIRYTFSATNPVNRRADIDRAQWYLDREATRMEVYGEYS